MTEIEPGHYARKQLSSRSRLVSWSHGSRFETARQLVQGRAGSRLLDYGCGDGTFLALVADLFPAAVGVDVSPAQIADCARRFGSHRAIRFAMADALDEPDHRGRYDVIVCMEVLEHCPDDVRTGVLDRLQGAAAPGALVVFSVPIEVGPALLAKQAVRALAARRGLVEYATRERYRPGELLRMLCAGVDSSLVREEIVEDLGAGRRLRFTGHKGFNWRRLVPELAAHFSIERRLCSPLPVMGPVLNSQVWFLCRAR
ncbi:MAG TPA: class I SAM-dependent methyltransferase [Vicinamibacterales bacterium]|nr:class I SAM-dependent methyltransferase [Vicinamibacterales bacterium]